MRTISKCAHVAHCIKKKVCYYGKPEKAGFHCSFFDNKIRDYKPKKLTKSEKALKKMKKEYEEKDERFKDRINKLKRRRLLLLTKYEPRFGALEEKIIKERSTE